MSNFTEGSKGSEGHFRLPQSNLRLPMMGDTVLYTLADGPRAGTDRAALVTEVQPDGRLALSVLTNPATDGLGATYHDYNVPHSETPKPRTWRHRPTPEPDLFRSEN